MKIKPTDEIPDGEQQHVIFQSPDGEELFDLYFQAHQWRAIEAAAKAKGLLPEDWIKITLDSKLT